MYQFLKDLSEADLKHGIVEFCKRHKEIYPNTNVIAHIRSYAKQKNLVADHEAWQIVNDAIAHQQRHFWNATTGIPPKPVFDDAQIDLTVQRVGWRVLVLRENESFDRSHFFRVYNDICDRL